MSLDMSKALKVLSTTVLVAVSISSVAGAYLVYKTHIWHPKVFVDSVDFNNGIAQLTINGEKRTLYGDSSLWAGGDWGVRFSKNQQGKYVRLELMKGNWVHNTIKAA